ncbi:MAG: sulfite exporter TauE/SafE family protein [Myxococcota bacterium]
MDFAWTALAVALAAVFVGAVAQGTVGFGLALVAAPVLAQLDPAWVPGPVLLVMLGLSCVMAWRERHHVDRRALRVPMLGQGVGIALALAVLGWVDPRSLQILIGMLIGLAVLLSSLGVNLEPRRVSLAVAGTLAGFMGTTAAIPGPPLALLYRNGPPARLRGVMAHFFIVGNTLSLMGLAWMGRFGGSELVLGLVLLPAAFAGYAVATRLGDRLEGAPIRVGVLIFSGLGALSLIYRSL